MTEQDRDPNYVPTFSHQDLPERAKALSEGPARGGAPEPVASQALGAVLASATAAMTPAFTDGTPAARQPRQAALRPMLAQLPPNTRDPLAELRPRMHAKFLAAAEAWTFASENLLLLGPTGAGKTTAAAWIVRRQAEIAATGDDEFSPEARRFWGGCRNPFEVVQLIRWQGCRELSKTVSEWPLGQGPSDIIQRCQHARLLVLDDIGGTDDAATLERVLNERQQRRWPTIATSGLTLRELTSTFGEALVRRLLQCNGRDGRIVSLFPTKRTP